MSEKKQCEYCEIPIESDERLDKFKRMPNKVNLLKRRDAGVYFTIENKGLYTADNCPICGRKLT